MDEAQKIAKALKPPKCPKCGDEIDHLVYMAKELVKANFWVTDETFEYSSWDTLDTDYNTIEYRCPECDEVLLNEQTDAEKFLRGELDENCEQPSM